MSLVITEISKFGVVMAADTAETVEISGRSGRKYIRTKFGTPKLHPIKALRGGVSYWGAGELLIDTGGSGRIPTDIWLEDFIATENHLQTLEQFAYTLKRNLQTFLGSESPHLGFQVAGAADGGGVSQSYFYRICNFDSRGGRRPEFEVEATSNFPRINSENSIFPDGDQAVFTRLLDGINRGGPLMTSRGDPIPSDSLQGRGDYVRACVRFISDLYQSAGLERTIGGAVTTVLIPPTGAFEMLTI